MHTFRRIRPLARLGLYTGKEKSPDANVLFASIQTLGRPHHLGQFARDILITSLWTSFTMRPPDVPSADRVFHASIPAGAYGHTGAHGRW